MKFFQTYTHIVIYLILIHETNLVSSGDHVNIEQESLVFDLKNSLGIKDLNNSSLNGIKPVELDININKSTENFECIFEKTNGNKIYKVKKGFGFSIVKLKKGSLNCFAKDKIIWEAKDKNEYAEEVIFREIKHRCDNDLNYLSLTIHLLNGIVKQFSKTMGFVSVNNNEWMQTTYDIPKSESPPQITIITQDDENNGIIENDFSKFELSKHHIRDEVFEYIYKFYKNGKCVEVKYDNKVVWNHNDKHDFPSIDKISFVPSRKIIVFYKNNIQFYVFSIEKEMTSKLNNVDLEGVHTEA